MEAVICSLKDERGLRAALKGVDVIFHLAGAERKGSRADLMGVDIEGTLTIARAAADSSVQRFFYLSHLGADRASAYPVLKAKAIAESHVMHSGVPYTVFRTGPVYGPGDQFTTHLMRLLKASPGWFLMPGNGSSLLQPIWIEDLLTCLSLALEDPHTSNRTFSIGGPEHLTFREVVQTILSALRLRRGIIQVSPAYLRILAVWAESTWKNFPLSIFWLDYLAANRTCELDTLPRLFGLMPVRFNRQLDYLKISRTHPPALET